MGVLFSICCISRLGFIVVKMVLCSVVECLFGVFGVLLNRVW